MGEEETKPLTIQELPDLRRKTEAVSQFLRKQITAHLETLRPLFAPEGVLGKYSGGRVELAAADRAVNELQQGYRPFVNKPYDLPRDFETHWLTLVGNSLELHPWEYEHPVQGKSITMTSPVRWAVNYKGNYSLAQTRKVIAGKEAARADFLRQFVVNALVLQLVGARNPGLARLFADLRYELKIETPADLRGLPVLTITSCLPSFRPADDLIAAATAFSGVPAFIELLETESLRQPSDPLQARLEELMK